MKNDSVRKLAESFIYSVTKPYTALNPVRYNTVATDGDFYFTR